MAANKKSKNETQETEEIKEELKALPILPSLTEITVTLTYGQYAPLIFVMNRIASRKLREIQSEFFGLDQEEQREREIAHYSNMIGSLLKERPQNVPGFPEEGNFKEQFFELFNSEDLADTVRDIWNEYQNMLYPKETMSMLLG